VAVVAVVALSPCSPHGRISKKCSGSSLAAIVEARRKLEYDLRAQQQWVVVNFV